MASKYEKIQFPNDQLTMFEPELIKPIYLTSRIPIDKKIRSELEHIATESSKYELLCGEYQITSEENRHKKICRYLNSGDSSLSLILIDFEDKIIGAAYIWNGVQPFEDENSDPVIECAFIHPNYAEYAKIISSKLSTYLNKSSKSFN